MARLLVVEDDPAIAQLLADHLRRSAHDVDTAADGWTALELHARQRPDLMVLDLMLPGCSGLEVCHRVRARGEPQPIVLVLTARSDESDAVDAFDAGADDYVRKPFGVQELGKRVDALLRFQARARPARGGAGVELRFGALRIDAGARSVHVGDTPVHLTPMEFDLLAHLAAHPDRVLSREDLLASIWGYRHAGYARTVDSHVTRLRKKLLACGLARDPIATAHRVGYRFQPPEGGA